MLTITNGGWWYGAVLQNNGILQYQPIPLSGIFLHLCCLQDVNYLQSVAFISKLIWNIQCLNINFVLSINNA